MADLKELMKINSNRNTLGSPPLLEEASTNLQAPESAPASEPPALETPPAPKPSAPRLESKPIPQPRIDGRALRRSGRTVAFATRVTPEFDQTIRQIAQERGLLIVEILEQALAAYHKANS